MGKVDYMLYAVFEYIEPDMEDYGLMHVHKIKKTIDAANRFQLGVHIDDVKIQDVFPEPIAHVKLKNPVKVLAHDMRRDPDDGVPGFKLMKNHEDIDSLMSVLPERPCIHEVWAWFDVQRAIVHFLKANGIKLITLDSFINKYLGFKFSEHELHIGCIYVVKYGPIRNVKIESIPSMPAVRVEVSRRMHSNLGQLRVLVRECKLDKQSEQDAFEEFIPVNCCVAVVNMAKTPLKIDVDIFDQNNQQVYFLRKVTFLGGPVERKPNRVLKALGEAASNVIGLEDYLRPAILAKEREKEIANMEFIFFDGDRDSKKNEQNKKSAHDCVMRILYSCKEECIICDPYFNHFNFNEYIIPISDLDISVRILNCKDQIKKVKLDDGRHAGKVLKETVDNYKAVNNKMNVECKVMAGDGRIHDRFIITDKYGWIIGSSFGELGDRACSIIKMSDATRMEILRIFNEWWNSNDQSVILTLDQYYQQLIDAEIAYAQKLAERKAKEDEALDDANK